VASFETPHAAAESWTRLRRDDIGSDCWLRRLPQADFADQRLDRAAGEAETGSSTSRPSRTLVSAAVIMTSRRQRDARQA